MSKDTNKASGTTAKKKQGPLGRGLTPGGYEGIFASIEVPAPIAAERGPQEIDIDLIDTDPDQPRTVFDEKQLHDLGASIKHHGLIQPIVVTKTGDRYLIIAGERRFRAAREIGLRQIPAIVRDTMPAEKLELALVENLQRTDLNPMEQSHALHRLMTEHRLSQQDIADRLGKSRSSIANILRLTSLPSEVTDMISAGALSLGHAKALLGLSDPDIITKLAKEVVEKQLSVRETEDLAKLAGEYDPASGDPEKDQKRPPRQNRRSPFAEAQAQLTEALGTKVRIAGSETKGRITIEYVSKDQLEDFFERLKSLQQHQNA